MRFFIALQIVLAMLLSAVLPISVVRADEFKPNIPKEFIRTEGTKFTDGNGNEFIIKGMGFWNGKP